MGRLRVGPKHSPGTGTPRAKPAQQREQETRTPRADAARPPLRTSTRPGGPAPRRSVPAAREAGPAPRRPRPLGRGLAPPTAPRPELPESAPPPGCVAACAHGAGALGFRQRDGRASGQPGPGSAGRPVGACALPPALLCARPSLPAPAGWALQGRPGPRGWPLAPLYSEASGRP